MDIIKEMEAYAQEFHIPIMQAEGLEFLLSYIEENKAIDILEIGSAIGYSAIRMAGLNKDIHVDTVERDEERYKEALKNCIAAHMENQISCYLEDALEWNPPRKAYDFIFIDAAKAQYIKFFERYEPYLKPNGTILTDNLGFHGLVDGDEEIHSRNLRRLVRKIKEYRTYLETNHAFETTFYEFGDGIAVTKRKK